MRLVVRTVRLRPAELLRMRSVAVVRDAVQLALGRGEAVGSVHLDLPADRSAPAVVPVGAVGPTL
ncbi:hypothetical protein [Kitasatospora sp. NPDC057500]|uniref:hypothetical protein n=1 Tax=Kitasatospora sp. NPDC057500 TaxID=3346151 RepID=UPI00368B9E2C